MPTEIIFENLTHKGREEIIKVCVWGGEGGEGGSDIDGIL